MVIVNIKDSSGKIDVTDIIENCPEPTSDEWARAHVAVASLANYIYPGYDGSVSSTTTIR